MFPNQNTGSSVTGAEDDFSAFVRQAVADEFAKSQVQSQDPGQQQAQSQIPVVLNGQTYNFNTPAEVSSAFQTTVSQYAAEIERLKAEKITAASTPTGGQVSGNDEPDFNIGKFVDFMTTDPRKAFDYVDELRYGMKNPTEAIKEAIATKDKVGQMQQALDVYRFRDNHPEFQANPQNAAIIQNVISQAALNPDYNGLEAAYAIARTRGLIQHPQDQQFQQNNSAFGQQPQYQGTNWSPQYQNAQTQPQFNFQGHGAPPPRVSRQAAAPADDFAAMAENMTPEQIEGIFARFQS